MAGPGALVVYLPLLLAFNPCPPTIAHPTSPAPHHPTTLSAGWLFKKLYGRLPGDNDRAPMHDPDLDTEYRFDVHFIGAGGCWWVLDGWSGMAGGFGCGAGGLCMCFLSCMPATSSGKPAACARSDPPAVPSSTANVHYITGRTFSCWVKESGLQAGEQIRIKREGARVLIQRVPTDRKVGCSVGVEIAGLG